MGCMKSKQLIKLEKCIVQESPMINHKNAFTELQPTIEIKTDDENNINDKVKKNDHMTDTIK